MASQSTLQEFQNSWNQTAAWAQSKGIKYNDYYPIYQKDSQQLLQYGSGMSTAERERAIIAASNPNASTQATPSTAPDPGNVIGNTRTDLRNIFTGIGDIAIHPLHNGLTDSIKNTFDLLDGSHHLTGSNPASKLGDALTSTVLGWIPGAADIGTILQSDTKGKGPVVGLEQLVDHPVSSLLDVLPIVNKAVELKVAGDAEFADRVGLSTEAGPKPSIGRAVKGYVMNTPTSKLGPGGIMTIGDRWQNLLGASVLGTNPDIADAALGTETVPSLFTAEEKFIFKPTDEALAAFGDDAKGEQLRQQFYDVMNPNHATNLEERLADPDLDPRVKEAAEAVVRGPAKFMTEETLAASDGPVLIRNPFTGKTGMYATTDHPTVVLAKRGYDKAAARILKNDMLPEMEKLKQQQDAAAQFLAQHTEQLEQANQAARNVDMTDQGNVAVQNIGDKRMTGFSKQRIAQTMFGTGGFIDKILDAARDGKYLNVVELSDAALDRLSEWGPRKVDASEAPEFAAVRDQVTQLGKAAKAMDETGKRIHASIYGKAKEWEGDKPYRDELHQEQAKELRATHRQQLKDLGAQRKQQYQKLAMAFKMKKEEIRFRYAKAKAERDAYVKDQTQAINEKYGLEQAKVETKHLGYREAHQEWLKGRRAQGLPASRDPLKRMEEGTQLMPGQLGTREAMKAEQDVLEIAKQKELKDLIESVPTRQHLDAQMQGELKAADVAQAGMKDRLRKVYEKQGKELTDRQKDETKALEKEHYGKKGREGKISKAYREYLKAQKTFTKSVWKHPPDNYSDLYFSVFAKHLIASEKAQGVLADVEKHLADKYDWGEDSINNLRSNPKVMANLVVLALNGTFDNPIFNDVDKDILKGVQQSALDEIQRLATEGIHPQYIPHVSSAQLAADGTGSYGIRLLVGKGIPKPDALSARTWGMESSKYDIMAGFHRGVKQVLDRDATISYVDRYLSPRVVTAAQLRDTVFDYYQDHVSTLDDQAVTDFITGKLKDWNLVKFDPQGIFGFTLPRWGKNDVYLDSNLVDAVKKLTERKALPTKGVFDKATKLFRYSILGLSPRYTAHILFGGSFLLALRSSPYMLTFLTQAWKQLKNGELPEDLLAPPTNMGATDYEIRTPHDAVQSFGRASGKQQVRLMGQEWIERNLGIKWQQASPLHWLKALADLNLHFTNHVTNMQRAVAYLDGAAQAARHTVTDEFGNPVEMTKERMMQEGMEHAAHVMGDLRKMSPFERQVAKSAVPFYGWSKHILQYVLSFPADHPWRALMLSQMAEYDTEHTPAGLPSRYQFLFFLGGVDDQGNATALDLRAVNPLRDVANYATWGGIISSLNPVVSAAATVIDPEIIYGGNELYPNVTYDQFYGIEDAGAQGNIVTAAEQIVPQISAIQSATQLASLRQGMSSADLVKSIGESLNFPWVPQHINLKQEAATNAIAQYHVASQLAQNAWETGDFSSIADLGSVPDPRNPDYETPVSELEQLYQQLAQEYPGEPPSTTATPLPAVTI